MDLSYRNAVISDLPTLVAMLGDDDLGSEREDLSIPPNDKYIDAFN